MDPLQTILESKDRAVYSLESGSTVYEAVETMCEKKIGAVLVTHGGVPIGILSERDVLTRVLLQHRDPTEITVGTAMTREVVCVELDTRPDEILEIMTRRRLRHIPVLNEGHVVGMVSIGDLVHWTLQTRDNEIRELREYVGGGYPDTTPNIMV